MQGLAPPAPLRGYPSSDMTLKLQQDPISKLGCQANPPSSWQL